MGRPRQSKRYHVDEKHTLLHGECPSALDMGFGSTLTKEFQAPLCQVHHLAFILFFEIGLRLDLPA